MAWYVVSTRPHQEARAVQHLARQGFEPWLPQIRKTRRHARRTEVGTAALFPGYLFVAFDFSSQPWRSINGTCGVQRLICQGDHPIPVPESFMVELRAQHDADGFFVAPETAFLLGDKVRFLGGPFTDCVATILRLGEGDRIWLLLDLLGRQVTTAALRRDIAAAA